MDFVYRSIYDELSLSVGQHMPAHLRMFAEPMGPNKTTVSTNMYHAMRLPAPQQMLIESIAFTIANCSDPRDVSTLSQDCAWRLVVGDKIFADGVMCHMTHRRGEINPIRTCDYCRSVYANTLRCPNCGASQFEINRWLPEEPSSHQFHQETVHPVVVLQQQSFHLEITSPHHWAIQGKLRFWCNLGGWIARAVQ